MSTRLLGRLGTSLLVAIAAWGLLGIGSARAQVTIIDVVGNLPADEYNQFIASQRLFKDWGNEPIIAVNPMDPTKIAIASFAYPAFVNRPEVAGKASLWYSADGGNSWGIRFPIPSAPVPQTGVPNDQVIAYDSAGCLHGAFLTFGSQQNVYHGMTADPNLDGVNGRDPSVWQWNTTRANLPAFTNNTVDQPWLAVGPNPNGNTNVLVGYSSFRGPGAEMRVTASNDNGATFTSDNPVSRGGPLGTNANPGLRIATDQAGNVYSIFGRGDAAGPNGTSHIQYRLNMSSDGGATWSFTNATPTPGGLVVADGYSLQLTSSFGGVNRLTGNITAVAADPTGAHVYAVYGMRDGPNGTGTDRIWLAEFHPDNDFGLVQRDNPVALSVEGQRSALPAVAVTDDGTIWVMYDTFTTADRLFHVHLAMSTDFGLTFTDQDLYDFSGDGIPFPNTRLLGDYQNLIALGNSVFGVFSARGNVSNADIDTTDKDVPFYFTNGLGKFAGPVPEPASLSLLAFGGGLIWWALRWRSARVRG